MARWSRRRLWLAVVAAGNVILWGSLALATSLIAGKRLDLGIESSVRVYQATALASWSGGRPQGTAGEPGSGADPGRPALGSEPGVSLEESAAEATAAAEEAPATPQITPIGGTVTRASASAAATPGAAAFEPSPAEALTAAPLLLADPALGDLASIDQQMTLSAPGRAVQIRYLETSLNREIEGLLLAQGDVPYRNIRVDLGSGTVILTGNVFLLGVPVQAEVRGSLMARDCRPAIELSSVKVGRLFTPTLIRQRLEGLLEEAMTWYPADYPLCIDGIVVQDDRATVYGHRR